MKKISFFTEVPGLERTAPPQLTSQTKPKWWDLQRTFYEKIKNGRKKKSMTIKSCPVIRDNLESGITLVAWCDWMVYRSEQDYCAVPSCERFQARRHKQDQFKEFKPSDGRYYQDVLKLINPWNIILPKGYSALLSRPFGYDGNGLTLLEGVVDSDNYMKLHLNFFVERGTEPIKIRRGTPLARLLPFRRESWVLDARFATPEDRQKIEGHQIASKLFFSNNYKENVWCPKKSLSG